MSGSRLVALPHLLEDHRRVLLEIPLRIVLIVVVALVVRALLHRSITRVTTPHRGTEMPRILRPLKERVEASPLVESSGLLSERRVQRAATIGSVLKSFTSFVIFGLALLLVLGELQFDLAPFIAGTSIVGVALGFGAQNPVKDFLSGMFMILEDQYGVGDVIDFEKATGTVEAVGLRSTRLRDANGVIWYVRNGEVLRVGNKTQGESTLTVDVPIPPGAPLDPAVRSITAAAADLAAEAEWGAVFLAAPEVQGVETMTHEATTVRLVTRVNAADQWRAARELRTRIRRRFDEDASAWPA